MELRAEEISQIIKEQIPSPSKRMVRCKVQRSILASVLECYRS